MHLFHLSVTQNTLIANVKEGEQSFTFIERAST